MAQARKILVTGASGLLGSFLTPFLARQGHDVVTQGLSGKVATDFRVDTTDTAATRAMLDQARPDVIVNLVGLTNVDRCEEDPRAAFQLNVRSVETLADWVKDSGGCHLVHISTDQVYDGPGPHQEQTVDIVNVYALSKYAGELAAAACGATVLRTNFFGPSVHPDRASFSDWVMGKLKAGEAFTGFEDVEFSPLSMATLSAAIERVAALPQEGIFNLGSRTGCSKAAFARLVARRFGFDEKLVRSGSQADVSLTARRPTDMRMDSRLFEERFDFILPETTAEIDGINQQDA